MAFLLTGFGISIVAMIVLLVFFPKIKGHRLSLDTFWIPPLIGALVLLFSSVLDWQSFFDGLTSNTAMNPLEILALFFSMTFLSTVLDEVGFFEKLASLMVKKAGKSQFALFFLLYSLSSILTIFTSNDIVIITLTPFLIFFAKNAKINPVPYLVSEFVAANTWSTLLIIGNPTNIYLASAAGISFFQYLSKMALPTIVGGAVSLSIMFLLFRKSLQAPLQVEAPTVKIKDKFLFLVALILLSCCIVLMALSSFFSIPMWLISVSSAGLLLVVFLFYLFFKPSTGCILTGSLKRLPFSLAPFLLSMFAFVLAFKKTGISLKVASYLSSFSSPVFSYGIASFLSANIMNNIPMSVLFSSLLTLAPTSPNAIYATILSSNIAAFFAPLGALAGIMWMSILKEKGISFSFLRFTLYGALISIPTITASLSILLL